MASNRIIYKLFINDILDSYANSFSFNFMKKPVQMKFSENHATIILERTTKYKPEDIANGKYAVFSEAIKKILLVHILLYSKCIDITTVSVMVRDNISVFNNKDSGIKPISSLIHKELDPKFKEQWKEKALIETIIDTNKTEEDTRMSALFAFILSRNRKSVIERFVDLWISFNGMYSYFSSLFVDNTRKEAEQLKRFIIQTGEGDTKIDSALTDRIARRITDHLKEYEIDLITYDWLNTEEGKLFSNKIVNQIIAEVSEIEKKYNEHISELKSNQKTVDKEQKDIMQRKINSYNQKIKNLKPYKTYNSSAYIYFLVEYAYYFRCKYIHANEVLPLFTYDNEHIIRCISLVNRLLDNYIDNNLYKWFSTRYVNEKLKPLAK